MHLGRLGEQVVLVSEKSFEKLHFVGTEEALRSKYYVLKMKRDKEARAAYFNDRESEDLSGLYMIDIVRQEVKADDPRLR